MLGTSWITPSLKRKDENNKQGKNLNYTESEKSAAVERFLVGGESVSAIAADTGISRSTLYARINSAQMEPDMLDFSLKNFRIPETR